MIFLFTEDDGWDFNWSELRNKNNFLIGTTKILIVKKIMNYPTPEKL